MSLGDLLKAYGRWTVRRRGLALALCGVLSLLAVATVGLRLARGSLPVDFTPQALFMDSTLALERMRVIEETFGREDNDLVLILDGLRPEA